MKGLKRTVRKNGTPLGHRFGVNGSQLLDYVSARKKIYLPVYHWVLENKLSNELDQLRSIHDKQDIILLDYETNEDIENETKPLSHASLIKQFLLRPIS